MANNFTWASFAVRVPSGPLTQRRMVDLCRWIDESEDLGLGITADVAPLDPELFGAKAEAIAATLRVHLENHTGIGFRWLVDSSDDLPALAFYHDESIDMESAVLVAQIILDLSDDDTVVTASWADVCDKPRVGEFGGGVVVFTRTRAEWSATWSMEELLRAKLAAA